MSRADVQEAVAELAVWRHRIDVGYGVVTPGNEDCEAEVHKLALPVDLTGRRVLDVGCSDGFYSFTCEERGAHDVLAVDDFSSLMNPERNGFAIAAELRGSNVRFQHRSVYDLDPDIDGLFDVVLFLNVLYHLKHPLLALEKLASVTSPGGELYLKTYFRRDLRVWWRGRAFGFDWTRRPKLWFFPGDELAHDPTNWCAPNLTCLDAMLVTAGYRRLEHLRTADDRVYVRATRS